MPGEAVSALAPVTSVLGPSVPGNFMVNLAARVWAAVLQLLFVPVYIRLLGPEAYGLIGLYGSLVVALGFLDQAVSPALIREFARMSGDPARTRDMRDLLRTLEVITAAVGVAIGAAVFLLAPVIATVWLKYQTLPQDHVVLAARLMGLGLASQWPSLLYSGGYIGLARQGTLAWLRIAGLTTQWAGAALALWALGARVEVFFAWQVLSMALLSVMLGAGLWRLLPDPSHRPHAGLASVRGVWRYAAGTFLIGLSASVLTQADKLIVSSAVPLGQFAAYSLSFMVGMLVSNFVAGPMTAALLPHFARLGRPGNERQLALEYHRWSQVLMVALLPVCGVLILFARPLLEAWLAGRQEVVTQMVPLIPWVVLGTLFNVVAVLPFILQLAAGRTRLAVVMNVVAVLVIVPVLWIGVPRLGPIVGAWCWFAVNLAYYLLYAPLVHRRLLRGEIAGWWLRDTLFPGAIAAAFFGAIAGIAPGALARPSAAVMAGIGAAVLLALALPHPRAMVKEASDRLVKSWT